ncbi:MAG: M23 family metallopeptidase [Aphanocapsa lilacina HA4352-LM1]|jgi:hypothetical protein|nr:M23 family metallopeptidase [Aphanocapsa lilacina HA4352-LM1]
MAPSQQPDLHSPLKHLRITSRFGMRIHPIRRTRRLHKGVDLRAPTGTPVYAAADGAVEAAGRQGGYGNAVLIDHGGGWKTRYAHLDSVRVQAGAPVAAGKPIGRAGNTGLSKGPHLHFELLHNGRPIDPMPYLQAAAKPNRAASVAAAAKTILERRGYTDAQGTRSYRGHSYNFDKEGSRLTVSEPGGRGAILEVDGGRVLTDRVTARDATILGEVRRRLLAPPAPERQPSRVPLAVPDRPRPQALEHQPE